MTDTIVAFYIDNDSLTRFDSFYAELLKLGDDFDILVLDCTNNSGVERKFSAKFLKSQTRLNITRYTLSELAKLTINSKKTVRAARYNKICEILGKKYKYVLLVEPEYTLQWNAIKLLREALVNGNAHMASALVMKSGVARHGFIQEDSLMPSNGKGFTLSSVGLTSTSEITAVNWSEFACFMITQEALQIAFRAYETLPHELDILYGASLKHYGLKHIVVPNVGVIYRGT